MKQTIAIDVDDVLAAHVPAFVAFSNQRYGTNLTVEDYEGHFAKVWEVEHEEVERRALEFHTSVSAAEYELIAASNITIMSLSQHYNLKIVTARRKEMIQPTLEWLEQYFPGVFNDVHFVPIWEPNNLVTKADICKEIGADYLIDDLPEHCIIASAGGIESLLFGDYAWNRTHDLIPGMTRVRNWDEVLQYFESKRTHSQLQDVYTTTA